MSVAIFFIENYIAGGSDKFAKLLIERLPFRKVYLFVNAHNDFSIIRPDELSSRIEMIRYGLPTTHELGAFALKWRHVKPLYYLLRTFNAFVRYPLILWTLLYFYFSFRRISPDFFVANNGGYPGGEYCRSATLAASLLKKVRVFHIIHNMPTLPKIGAMKPIEHFYDRLIDRRSMLVCVSDATRVAMIRKRNIKQNITLVYNGTEEKPIKTYPPLKTLKLLNVGYYGATKNQRMLVETVMRVIEKGYGSVVLYLVGKDVEPDYANELRSLVRQYGLEGHVIMEGFIGDVYRYYYDCDVFVLSSTVESFSLAVLEAMSIGMPVITTPAGGTPEQVEDAVNGFIVGHGDIETLAEKIIFFMEHPSKMEEFGRRGRELCCTRFSHETMLKAYSRLFGLDGI